jgi:lipoprotein-releasing system permease protein
MYKLFMAFRYLRAHKIIYFSIAGVAFGIMTMVIVTSIMGGFSRDMRTRIRGMQTDLVVTSHDQESRFWIVNPEGLRSEILKVPGVTGAAPRIEYEAWLGRAGTRRPVHLVGIQPEEEEKVSDLKLFFERGGKRRFNFAFDSGVEPERPGVVVGAELHRDYFDSKVGLMTALDQTTPVFCNKDFDEVGTFRSGMSEYDTTYVVMHLAQAQDFLKLAAPARANVIAVSIENYERDHERVRAAVIEAIHRFRPCASGDHRYGRCGFFRTLTWEQVKSNLLQAVAVEKGIQIIVMFMIVLVAGFNIIAIYTLVVRAKSRDIGILRALGASERGVISIFLASGGLCGLFGSIFGIILGLLFSFNVNEIEGFIRVVSRDMSRMAYRGDPASPNWLMAWLSTGTLAGAGAAVVWNWMMFYKERRPHPWVRMAAALAALYAATWFTTSWAPGYSPLDRFDPDVGKNFQPVLARWVGGAWFVLMAAWRYLDRWRRRPAWIFFGFAATIVFSAFVIAILGSLAIALSIAVLHPPDGWRGLELFPRQIYYLDRIPVYVDYNALGFIVAMTLLISVMFSIYPALRAAKANPIEVMRDEA